MRCKKPTGMNSLSVRILLAYVAGTLLSIGLLVLFGAIVQDRLPGMELPDRAQALVGHLTFDTQGKPTGLIDSKEHPLWIYDSLRQETAWRLLDDQGNVVLSSADKTFWPARKDITELPSRRFAFSREGVLYEGATGSVENNGRGWFLQLVVSSRIVDFLHQGFALPFIRLGIVVFSLLLLLIFTACAWVSLKYSLRPLRNVSQAAMQISPQALSERLRTEQVPAELIPLITSFNQALDRLENGFRTQQEFLAKAAHELKTPLTLLRTEVELMDDNTDVREALLAQVAHLTRQVQQLLLLAEASEPLSYQFTDVDAYQIACDTVDYLQKIADDAGVKLRVNAAEAISKWRADRGAFFTLLKNLIENAVQHSPVGATVSVDIRSGSLSVRDCGAGVAEEHIPHLFERFWRGAHRRDVGAGLGLAICQEICSAHGWTLAAFNGEAGLVVRVDRGCPQRSGE